MRPHCCAYRAGGDWRSLQRMFVLTNIFPCAKSLGKIFIFNFNALFNYVKRLLRITTENERERDGKRGRRTTDRGKLDNFKFKSCAAHKMLKDVSCLPIKPTKNGLKIAFFSQHFSFLFIPSSIWQWFTWGIWSYAIWCARNSCMTI